MNIALAEDAIEKYTTPGECNMFTHKCNKMLLMWTVGYYGTCFDTEYGIKVGPNGYLYGVMEVKAKYNLYFYQYNLFC